jgi:hypothetical protein
MPLLNKFVKYIKYLIFFYLKHLIVQCLLKICYFVSVFILEISNIQIKLMDHKFLHFVFFPFHPIILFIN